MLQMVHISAEMWCTSHITVHISMEMHDDHEQILVLSNKWTAIWCSVISWNMLLATANFAWYITR